MIAALSIVILQQSALLKLGQTNLDGQEISIEIPVAKEFRGSAIQVGDQKLEVMAAGSLGKSFVTDGSWGDVATLYPSSQKAIAAGTAKPWICKVFLFTRVALLDLGSDGIYRFRRGVMDVPEVKDALAQLAAFEAAAEAISEGKLDIRLDITTNNDPIRLQVKNSGDLFGAEFVKDFVLPRINEDAFETEDKTYWGPFDSVFFIHAGRSSSENRLLESTPVSGFSYWIDGAHSQTRMLAENLLTAWKSHLTQTLRNIGYQVPVSPQNTFSILSLSMPSSLWTNFIERRKQTDQQFILRRFRPAKSSETNWDIVKDDPLALLSRLSADELETICGAKTVSEPAASSLVRTGPIDSRAIGKIAAIELSSDKAQECVLVDFDIAPFAIPNLLKLNEGKLIGTTILSGRVWIVVVGKVAVTGKPESILIGEAVSTPAIPLMGPTEFAVTQGELPRELSSNGNVIAVLSPEPDRADAIKITEAAGERFGYAQLSGAAGKALFDPSKLNELTFWVKTKSAENFAIQLGGIDGEIIIGESRKPAEAARPLTQTVVTNIVRDGAWHQVKVDLKPLLNSESTSPSIVYALNIAPPYDSHYWERKELGDAELSIGGFSVASSSEAIANASIATSDLDARIAAIATLQGPVTAEQSKEVMSLLQEPNEFARLNACMALTRVKIPEAVPSLALAGKGLNALVSHAASQALAIQATPEAWLALRTNLEKGSLDHVRQYSALALAEQRDPRTAALLSTMLTARSANARADGAKAVAMQSSREAAIILMAMLNDVDPVVRLAVTKGANPEYEVVCRKLLWGAVNDSSEAVRIESYQKLLSSPIAEYRAEGMKGFRDESLAIQAAMLRAINKQTSADVLPALRLSVANSHAAISALALSAMSTVKFPITIEDVKPALARTDPRIQFALIQCAKSKTLNLPDACRAALRASLDPAVVAAERDLP